MIKIRLMRIGAKQKPFYRIVVVDERSKRTGAYIELLGTYNPLTNPHDIKLNKDRVDHWLKQGAQKSDGFLRILGEAPQRPPRKPKKEKKAKESSTEEKPSEQSSEVPTSETPTTEEPKTEDAPKEKPPMEEAKSETEAEIPNSEKKEDDSTNSTSSPQASSPQADQVSEPVPNEVKGSESVQNKK